MKHSFKIGIIAIVGAFVGAACSAEVPESNAADEALAAQPLVSEPSALADNLAEDPNEDVGSSSEALMTRIEIEAHCKVTKLRADAYCPDVIVGHGWTRPPFPSCRKGKTRALKDAQSQVRDGCALGPCQYVGC